MDEQLDQVWLRVREEPLPAAGREETLRLMAAEAAVFLPPGGETQQIAADAWERELVESTYIGLGLAVPHARLRGLHQAGLYMAYSPAGIPWPHEEAQFVALLVVPWEAPELHLQLLSRLVRWRKNLTEAEACALAESADKLMVALEAALQEL